MIKVSTVLWSVSLIAALVLVKPNVSKSLEALAGLKDLKVQSQDVKNKIAAVDSDLEAYKAKYSDLKFTSNYDLAKAISELDGIELSSIKSFAIKDGDYFECAEVSSIEDVNFFSEETKRMSFQLNLKNATKFVKSLKKSAIVTDSMIIDNGDKTVTMTVSSVFSTPTVDSDSESTNDGNGGDAESIEDSGPAKSNLGGE